MANTLKVPAIAKLLENRILAGDYALEALPSERKLAAELGVSHMTARKAVQHLINSGLIKRNSAHRREVRAKTSLKIACVTPEFESTYMTTLYKSLTTVVTARQGIVRGVSYTSWHDPVILDVLDGDFDGIFFVPPIDMPQFMLDRLAGVADRMVTLYQPMMDLGIPCVDNGRPDAVGGLVKHLVNLGHRHIAMFNVNPMTPVIEERIAAWRDEMARQNLSAPLFDSVVPPGEFCDVHAVPYMERLIDEGAIGPRSQVTAMICTMLEVARAIMRAMANRGLSVPKDLSLATCDAPRTAKMTVPSITTLDCPPADEFLARGLDWIQSRGKNWKGPMLIRPEQQVPVWAGESTIANTRV